MDYSTKTKAELVDLCKEKGVVGYSKKNKEQLISLLEAIPITPAPSSPSILSVPKTRSKTKAEKEAKEAAKFLKIWDKKTATSRMPLKRVKNEDIGPS